MKEKIEKIATEIYGAKDVVYEPAASKQLAKIEDMGFGNLPICMAKINTLYLMMRRSLTTRKILIFISVKYM